MLFASSTLLPFRCTPTEIILKFTADFNISSGDKIAVQLAGFTSGLCDNEEGQSISQLVIFKKNDLQWSCVSNRFHVNYKSQSFVDTLSILNSTWNMQPRLTCSVLSSAVQTVRRS